MSYVICHVSCVMRHLSWVMCHTSYVMCHVWFVICYLSCVICHVSFVISFNFLFCVIWHSVWFHISCHLIFRVIWHSLSFHISCHLTFRVILLISVIIFVSNGILMIQQEFCFMYSGLLFLMGRRHGGNFLERWVVGIGSGPRLACWDVSLLGQGFWVLWQAPKVDGLKTSLFDFLEPLVEVDHFPVDLGQGLLNVGVPHRRLSGTGFGWGQFFPLFRHLGDEEDDEQYGDCRQGESIQEEVGVHFWGSRFLWDTLGLWRELL